MKELWNSINKFYFANCALVAVFFLSIVFMFVAQFKVEMLQDEITRTEAEIIAYEDKIQLLEVEWVYLTRPERLRNLASLYLKDNSYTLASQIKASDKLEKYYLVNFKKSENEQLALNAALKEQNQIAEQVSF